LLKAPQIDLEEGVYVFICLIENVLVVVGFDTDLLSCEGGRWLRMDKQWTWWSFLRKPARQLRGQ
jgi:hypothetical protein